MRIAYPLNRIGRVALRIEGPAGPSQQTPRSATDIAKPGALRGGPARAASAFLATFALYNWALFLAVGLVSSALFALTDFELPRPASVFYVVAQTVPLLAATLATPVAAIVERFVNRKRGVDPSVRSRVRWSWIAMLTVDGVLLSIIVYSLLR